MVGLERKVSMPDLNGKKRSNGDEIKKGKPNLEQERKGSKNVEGRSDNKDPKAEVGSYQCVASTGIDSTEVYEEVDIHYMDDANRSEGTVMEANFNDRDNHANELGKQETNGNSTKAEKPSTKEEESDGDTGSQASEECKNERSSGVTKKQTNGRSQESCPRASRAATDRREAQKPNSRDAQKKASKARRKDPKTKSKTTDNKPKNPKVPAKPSSDCSTGSDEKSIEEVKEIDVLEEAPTGAGSIATDEEKADMEDIPLDEDPIAVADKIEDMEKRVEKLEGELRETAALEIALYSVVAEHGSSAHKVHAPARRLSRLYIHACKYWGQDRRASVARSAVLGLVLVSKACGNDVPRLTFWLSNTVVLREIISQAFNNSHNSNLATRIVESNGGGRRKSSALTWKGNSGNKQGKTTGFMQFVDDWQETSTFTGALEKIESWIFSRITESVWWQALAPHMQSPEEDLFTEKRHVRVLGPALGDQKQGSFSIDLWKGAFLEAQQRLCPVRAGGHECGCLPVLARMVMEQCVSRLDIAMFNAILRESVNEMPTDPVSDPICDPKVLPIPAGDLSFGAGAQLKNAVGNWSRCLNDLFGIEADDSPSDAKTDNENDERQGNDMASKSFHLISILSDLLMLPKDMLTDKMIRKEVCPAFGLPLIMRILCNFTPDEFCPDAVPGAVLEALNSEIISERVISERRPSAENKELINSIPCTASSIVYSPPSAANVAEKVGDSHFQRAGLNRTTSMVLRKGHTSDEELEELDFPLVSVIEKALVSPTILNVGDHGGGSNVRYELLREVWSAGV
ncbi:uncharacterized protein LOC18439920 [Amborella trichopoda]|nr:uncharacterized protein LOC18439920 [Amborella trichopoda]XP_011625465.1 uncharacterized protein LOC18439920 [Amborella trichopoda]XP_020526386.1 uncharacterized protein LOC18439920 [Amborella trichopoda]|eukprot:XP_006850138.2 uncharacterized protein LOC18439920 [Amborella trichopoda]